LPDGNGEVAVVREGEENRNQRDGGTSDEVARHQQHTVLHALGARADHEQQDHDHNRQAGKDDAVLEGGKLADEMQMLRGEKEKHKATINNTERA
jgi:hypothetical protein